MRLSSNLPPRPLLMAKIRLIDPFLVCLGNLLVIFPEHISKTPIDFTQLTEYLTSVGSEHPQARDPLEVQPIVPRHVHTYKYSLPPLISSPSLSWLGLLFVFTLSIGTYAENIRLLSCFYHPAAGTQTRPITTQYSTQKSGNPQITERDKS